MLFILTIFAFVFQVERLLFLKITFEGLFASIEICHKIMISFLVVIQVHLYQHLY